MNFKIIEKMCDYIENLRALGFYGATWSDIMSAIGELTPADKAALGQALIDAGATMRKDGIWDFSELPIDILYTTPCDDDDGEVTLVEIIAKVPTGVFGKTADGICRFVADPNYHPVYNTNDNEEDVTSAEDVGDDHSTSGKRGKLDLDL